MSPRASVPATPPPVTPPPAPAPASSNAIAALLARYGWTLADADFAPRVGRTMLAWHAARGDALDAELLRRAVTHEYCQVLHSALAGADRARRERALVETHGYGWPIAHRLLGNTHEAEGAVHSALLKLLRHLADCVPASFFAYFGRILTREIQQQQRSDRRVASHEFLVDDQATAQESDDAGAATHLERLAAAPRLAAYARMALDGAPDGDTRAVELHMMRPVLRAALIECLESRCNALIFLYGYGYARKTSDLARRLHLTPTALSLRKMRARDAILAQPCPQVIALLRLMLA